MGNHPVGGDDNAPAAASQLTQELRREIEPSEKLLWSGFPIQGVRLRGQDALLIPFSLLWGGFAVFWEYGVVTSNAPFFFDLWGIPFVAMGLWLIVGRFFGDAWSRARTVYGVTSSRVLIVSGVIRRGTRSLELLGLSEINLSERTDGYGTITFGPMSTFNALRGWPGSNPYQSPAFEGIARARQVHQIIREAQRAAASQRL